MKPLKIVGATLASLVVLFVAVFATMVYSGAYNVAATSKHWPITAWALNKTRQNSVAQRAEAIEPPDLKGQKQILIGVTNFDAMCSGCHAPPGAKPSPVAKGMYPEPPRLGHAGKEMAPNRIFWVIKHGIKASGMPAWGISHGDEEIWAMTAFIT